MRSLCVTECSRGGSLHTSAGKLQDVEIVVQQIVSQNIWSMKELVCLKMTMPSMLCEGPTIAWSIIYLTPFLIFLFFYFFKSKFEIMFGEQMIVSGWLFYVLWLSHRCRGIWVRQCIWVKPVTVLGQSWWKSEGLDPTLLSASHWIMISSSRCGLVQQLTPARHEAVVEKLWRSKSSISMFVRNSSDILTL